MKLPQYILTSFIFPSRYHSHLLLPFPHGYFRLAQMFELWLRTYDDFCGARKLDDQIEIMGGKKLSDPVDYGKTFADKILFQEYKKPEE